MRTNFGVSNIVLFSYNARLITKGLDVVPMVPYKAINNRDDLMDGVFGHVLSDFKFEIVDQEIWQYKVGVWMKAVFIFLTQLRC